MKKAVYFFKTKIYFGSIVFCCIGLYFLGKHFTQFRAKSRDDLEFSKATIENISVTMQGTRMSDYISLEGSKNFFKIEERHAGAYYKNRLINEAKKGDEVEIAVAKKDKEILGHPDEIITLYGLKGANGTYVDVDEVIQIEQKPGAEFYIGLGAIALGILVFCTGWFLLKLRPE